jgi:ribose/xylose/arabinose/galactoside ABC-type transport system permease subunit
MPDEKRTERGDTHRRRIPTGFRAINLLNWPAAIVIQRAVFALLMIIALLTPGFLSWPNILSLVTTISFVGCVAIGMTLITISGSIMSFSLGATVGLSAIVFILVTNFGGVGVGLIVTVAFGALINAAQGLIVGTVGANPIIVTIAALSVIGGCADAFTRGTTFYVNPGTSYGILKGSLWGVPIEFVILLGATAAGQFILTRTIFGRNLFMIGGSLPAAMAGGIKTWRTLTGAFLWAGVFSSVAGIMLAIRYDAASMNYGIGYDYDAVTAVLVGGTTINGGQGSIVRTLIGTVIIAMIQVILILYGFRIELQYLISGLIVLAVIILQMANERH